MIALWLLLAGCNDSRVDALEAEVAALRVENNELGNEVERLDDRVSALEAPRYASTVPTPPADPPPWLVRQDDDSYVVSRDRLPGADELVKLARLIPHRNADGVIDGYRISGIRIDSALALLGFKNGDILQSVEGTPLVDAESVLHAYEQAASAPDIHVELVRRGLPDALVIRVR